MIGKLQARDLPSVDDVLANLTALRNRFPHQVMVAEIRRALDEVRTAIRSGSHEGELDIEAHVLEHLERLDTPSLQHVINATGVVLHTNLGRAPLPQFSPHIGYTNLEYDLAKGQRGKRDVHTATLLERLTGAPGIVVNNNAAAVYLALNELASGQEVIVSRGELIEIGDGFRIPDIMTRSGAILREVGTTNRTRIEDYRDAINERTRLLMRVHPSNFQITGFTAKPELRELAALGRERHIPVYEDLGSGCIADLRPFGLHEPLVSESLRAGASLVSFSGDKLLGGPQAGMLVGDREIVARLRGNPMFRALRVDKLIYQALETTLRHILLERWEQIPALRMIALTADQVRTRAESFVGSLKGVPAEIVRGESVVGGGSTPQQPLATWLIVLHPVDIVASEQALRLRTPPIIARVQDNRLTIDLRTVFPEEERELAAALQEVYT